MPSAFEVTKDDHVVANLKTRAPCGEFLFFKFVAHMTDKLFGNAIEMHDRFEPKMMIAFESLHRLFF